MQEDLHTAIDLINKSIHSINSNNNVVTPKLAQPIMYKRNGQWRCRYGNLPDRVHANNKLNINWINTMNTVMDKNMAKAFSTSISSDSDRESDVESCDSDESDDRDESSDSYDSDDSDTSTKRSWLY